MYPPEYSVKTAKKCFQYEGLIPVNCSRTNFSLGKPLLIYMELTIRCIMRSRINIFCIANYVLITGGS